MRIIPALVCALAAATIPLQTRPASGQDDVFDFIPDGGRTLLERLAQSGLDDDLADAIRSVYSGNPVLATEATSALIRMKTGAQEPGSDLSERELEVLALVARGLSNEEIAEQLVISPATVRHHVSACLHKLDAANRAQAAALAVKYNLIP